MYEQQLIDYLKNEKSSKKQSNMSFTNYTTYTTPMSGIGASGVRLKERQKDIKVPPKMISDPVARQI